MPEITVKTDRWYTYNDYLKLDDGHDYEIVGGKLIVVPKPRPYHQEIVGALIEVLRGFLRQDRSGKIYSDVDVLFGDQVVSPDIVVILKEHLAIVQETHINGAPDLVIEVLSPSTEKYDRKQKSQLYYAHGVGEYWLVDPALQLVEIFVAGEKDWNRAGIYDEEDTLVSPFWPGLRVELKSIFAG